MEKIRLPVGISGQQKDSKSIGLAIGLENIFLEFLDFANSVFSWSRWRKMIIFSVHVKNPIWSMCLKHKNMLFVASGREMRKS